MLDVEKYIMEEFNLSDKIVMQAILIEDVKEFIKKLKEELFKYYGENNGWSKQIINKLAGEKLK